MLQDLEPLVAQYARSRQTLLQSINGLSDAELSELIPDRDWSIKDTLVHIATNEELMTHLLQEIAAGTNTALAADFDNQRFNDEHVALGRNETMAQVRADLDTSYGNLINVLETITPESLRRHGTHPAAGDSDVKNFLLAMYAHHEVHCRDVLEQSRRLRKSGTQ